MLQIRLSKAGGGSSEGGSVVVVGGGGAGSSGGGGIGVGGLGKGAAENVTVACPDHLIIADLPVAKALGAAPSSCSSSVRSVGRRCRRQLGERVHFCVSCDFPIAIYGRLIPCEHAFCLTCARSDSTCYLCDERIQKIQTIKMMEGIYICAAPHCLKSFLKRSDFESHIQELHGDLLRSNAEDGTNEAENTQKAASAETHGKQQTESSTARAPPRPGVSPSANSQDREDRPRRNQSREHTPMRPPQFPLLPFHGRQQQQQQQQQSSDSQTDTTPPPSQGAAWFQHPQQPQGFDSQSSSQQRRDSDQAMPERPSSVAQESPFRDYPPAHPFPLPNYPMPVIFNQGVNVPPFGFTPLPADRQQPLFHPPMEMAPRPEITGQQDQSSVLGFPPVPVGMPGFPENYPQWNNVVFANAQLVPQPVNIINPQGFVNPVDLQQVRPPFVQGDQDRGPDGLPQNPPMPKDEVPATQMGISDGKGVMTPLLSPIPVPHHLSISLPPPPPLPPPSVLQQQIRGNFPGPD